MLIQQSDFTIRYVTGIRTSLFNKFIEEAERIDIQQFLGPPLYYAFTSAMSDSPPPEKYTNLLNGTTYTYCGYTVMFSGLTIALQYFSYARYLANMEVPTNVGERIVSGEFSTLAEFKERQQKIEQMNSAALASLKEAEMFLNENKTTYDLWLKGPSNRSGGIKMRIT